MDSTQATSQTCPSCGNPLPLNRTSGKCGQCGLRLGTPVNSAPRESELAELAGEADAGWSMQRGVLLGGGRYRVEGQLGRGGFGEAYLAYDIKMRRPCVVKRLIRPPGCSRNRWQQLRASFRHEAEALVQLNTPGHANIPEVYTYLERPCCLVMKYIQGYSLADLLRKRDAPFPELEALRYIRDVCSALIYMHSRVPQPVLHRDIKPSNILLDATGRIWLIDFGLATALPSDSSSVALEVSGTPGYTPVEQWCGMAVPRSDVYALAVTLRQLITPGGDAEARTISTEIAELLRRATTLECEGRPSAEEFGAVIDAVLNRPPLPASFTPDRPPQVEMFIGREGELATLAERLKRDRCVVITGLAGVGKTSVAVVLARTFDEPQHTFWHTFHPGEKLERLIRTLAAYLVNHGQPGAARLLFQTFIDGQPVSFEQITSYLLDLLRGRQHLICLDDTHLADNDPEVGVLLRRLSTMAQAGELVLIATSRRAPLWNTNSEVTLLGGLCDADARDLLSTHGIALPAELIDQILAYTEGNTKLLHLTANLLKRQHDARHLLADLAEVDDIATYLVHQVDAGLSEAERAVMTALAVLHGYGGTRTVVEHLVEGDCWEALNSLRERYLLMSTPSPTGIVYVQHALVRLFYYRRLSQLRRRQLHRSAAHYYTHEQTQSIIAARHFLEADEQAEAARLLTTRVEAIIREGQAAELYTLLESLDAARMNQADWLEICETTGVVATVLGDFETARQRLEMAVSGAQTADHELQARARRHRLLSLVYERVGTYEQAIATCDQGLAIAQKLSKPDVEVARLFARQAAALCRVSQFEAAEQSCAAGLLVLPSVKETRRERIALWQVLAKIDSERGRYRDAAELLLQGIELVQALHEPALVASLQCDLGTVLHHLGDGVQAAYHFIESLRSRTEFGDEAGRIEALNGLGLVQWAQGEQEQALECFLESAQLCRRLGMLGHQAAALLNLGQLLVELGRPEEAESPLREACALYAGLGNRLKLAHGRYLLGDIALLRGQHSKALDEGQRALEIARRIGSMALEACALRVVGEALRGLAQPDAADRMLADAWRLQEQVEDPYDQALILSAWAEVAFERRQWGVARWRARRALKLAREQNLPLLVERLQGLLQELREWPSNRYCYFSRRRFTKPSP